MSCTKVCNTKRIIKPPATYKHEMKTSAGQEEPLPNTSSLVLSGPERGISSIFIWNSVLEIWMVTWEESVLKINNILNQKNGQVDQQEIDFRLGDKLSPEYLLLKCESTPVADLSSFCSERKLRLPDVDYLITFILNWVIIKLPPICVNIQSEMTTRDLPQHVNVNK